MEHRIGGGRIASTAVAVAMIGVLVIGVGVLTQGSSPQLTGKQSAAGIWVADETMGMLGRADPRSLQVEPVMPIGAEHVDLVQSSNTAFVIDRDRGEVSIVDAATLDRTPAVRLPSNDAQLVFAMVSDRADPDRLMDAAILSPRDGDVWIVPVTDFEAFDAESAPTFSFGAGSSLTVGEAGALFAASPRDGALYELSNGGAERHGRFEPFTGSALAPVQASVTTEGWSVLDPRSRRLTTDEGVVDLDGDGANLALETRLSSTVFGMRPSDAPPEGRDSVFVASDAGLIEASVDDVRTRVRAHDSSPARPFRIGDCVYGAWEADARAVDCDVAAPAVQLAGAHESAWGPASDLQPELRTDGHRVIANDPATGQTWAFTPQGPVQLTWAAEPSLESLDLSDPSPKVGVADGAAPPRRSVGPQEGGPSEPERSTDEMTPDDRADADAVEPPPSEDPPSDGPSEITAGRVETTVDRGAGTIAVSWDPFTSDASPVLGYLVQRLAPGEQPGECVVEAGTASVGGGDVQAATGTSTLFGGEAPPEGGYRFVVWGYTADACAAAPPVEVQPDATPSAVVDPHGAMQWDASRYDYNIAPGDAARYEVQRLDASGNTVGAVGTFAGSTRPRELTGGRFGEPVRFTIRACTVWGADAACSPWAEHAAPEPSLDFTLAELAYSEERSEWTWSALPDNGGKRIFVFCETRSGARVESGEGYCHALEPTSRSDASLSIRVAGITYQP